MHPFRRDDALRRLADESFDVLVIGGGVTGVGVALDAASRGLKTALVEKGDFASGTSSKSSKMVHGGIRYLQQREFRLVYENLAERQRLLDNAPHLVSPLPFLIPLFGRDGAVSKAVARSYATALWMYDLTGGWRIGERHREVSKDEALEHLGTLDTAHLVAGFLYFDARADDARLTLTIARTAALEYGAVVANYTPVVRLTTGPGGVADGAVVRAVPGDESSDFPVRARVVVNATGVWADAVRALDEGAHGQEIRPAKGVHVTVPADRMPCDIAAVIPVPKDKRSIFVVSWAETDLVYLGTTDTDYDGPLDDPACTPEDVDYLLDAANNVTTSKLTRADVTGVWAGLRPLLAPPESGKHLSERTADLSRRHTVSASPHGVVTVTGGKLTTYRKMAQDTVDVVVARLGESPRRRRCVTKSLSLIGATTKTRDPVAQAQPHARLVGRYGTESPAVLALAAGRPDLLQPVVDGLPYTGAELLYAVREEMACTLEDLLARRTRASIQRAHATMAAAPAVAALVAADLGWSDAAAADEAARFAKACEAELLTAGLET
ncbi:MAG TPA: glycerol-3-phosphate dehydrogenase/oxidase [Acidimicrobiales bacterium]|nr:glycerol-3-phosphate dehydrogenase/oxidase [Acidimicrobiales bacterium]